MSNFKLIIENLQYLEQFELLYPNGDLKEYALWLSDKMLQPRKFPSEQKIPDYSIQSKFSTDEYPEIEISTLITNLYRFARNYIKKALEDTPFKTVDEFGFLASLIEHNSLLKSELIQKHLMEISSGTEVIKRLLAAGMINELPDLHDGRAKRLSLTEKGREDLIKAFGEMHKAVKIINGNLTKDEQQRIVISLNKLKQFHWNIQKTHKQAPLDEILDKFIHITNTEQYA